MTSHVSVDPYWKRKFENIDCFPRKFKLNIRQKIAKLMFHYHFTEKKNLKKIILHCKKKNYILNSDFDIRKNQDNRV